MFNFFSCMKIKKHNFTFCKNAFKSFCEKERKEEILLYIMQDKYSVKPDKEFRINHSSMDRSTTKNEEKKFKTHKVISYDKQCIQESTNLKDKFHAIKSNIQRKAFAKLGPREYPYSVRQGYAGFSNYTFVSNVCFSAMNFITTQVLINSLNLNIDKATALVFSAGMNWAIKEGGGQIGSIIFTTKYSHTIERNAKPGRVFSILLCSLSFLMEATTLVLPKYFLLIATSANIVKLISLNCNFISRTAMIEHFSKDNNIVDLTNKFILQNNISILIGNVIGFGLSLVFPLNCFIPTFSILTIVSLLNIFTAFKTIKYIDFNYFNFQRICIFAEEYFNTKTILSPQEVSKREVLNYKKFSNLNFFNKSPELILKDDGNNLFLVQLFDLFRENNYFVTVKKKLNIRKLKYEYVINTYLRVNADNDDIFMSILYTIRLNMTLENFRKHFTITNEIIIDMMEENLKFFEEFDRKSLKSEMKKLDWVLNLSHLEEKYLRYHLLFKNM